MIKCKKLIGRKEWQNSKGKVHRIKGPAVEYDNGDKWWCQNGLCHRIDGPAIEFVGGDKEWYQNGLKHRLDGPAIEYTNGHKEWWILGKQFSKEEFGKQVELLNNQVKIIVILVK